MIQQEQLDKLLEVADRHARTVLIEFKMRRLMPTWALMTGTGEIQVVSTPWQDDREKWRYAALLRAGMRQQEVIAYSFVSEAWSATLELEEWDKETGRPLGDLRAGSHPARQEIVMACACSATLVCWRQWRIVREATTERIIELRERPLPESESQVESWLTQMLKDR
jgi:hypothetical protein